MAGSATLVAALVLVAGGCGGDEGSSAPVATLPGALRPGPTVLPPPGHGGTVPGSGPDASVPGALGPDGGAPEGAPVVEALDATLDPSCADASTTLRLEVSVAPAPAVRVVTVVLDGQPVASSPGGGTVEVPGVACDGGVHTVLVVATGLDDLSGTRSVAIRSPQA